VARPNTATNPKMTENNKAAKSFERKERMMRPLQLETKQKQYRNET